MMSDPTVLVVHLEHEQTSLLLFKSQSFVFTIFDRFGLKEFNVLSSSIQNLWMKKRFQKEMDANMRRFLKGLSKATKVARSDIVYMREQERALNMNYLSLQSTMRRSLMSVQRPKALNRDFVSPVYVPATAKSAIESHADTQQIQQMEREEPKGRKERVRSMITMLRPVPFPLRQYAMRAHPSKAPERIYRSKARENLREERLDMIDDYLNYHHEELRDMLDGTVDPVLHVGTFPEEEIKWNGKIPIQVL